jgi:DNA-directed RNA polymerase II subunit RPB2
MIKQKGVDLERIVKDKETDFKTTWQVMETYLRDTSFLVGHQLDGYNQFISHGIPQIIKENNPIRFLKDGQEILLYFGGRKGDQIYYGKPTLIEKDNQEYLYPNLARLHNMTYALSIHYDVDIEFTKEKEKREIKLEKVYLGKFPIMLQSNQCILNGLAPSARYYAGECLEDKGGYFIVDGMEKVILPQEKFADNMLYVRQDLSENAEYWYSCEIRSVSEDSSKPTRYTSVKMLAPTARVSNQQFVVILPNVRKPVPLFILMRALGVISDKDILKFCLLDLSEESATLELFRPSIYDARQIYTQTVALEFIGKLTKRQTLVSAQDILMNYFLPHLGTVNWIEKAYFVGMMVNRIVSVALEREKATDRDHFQYKRVESAGQLLYNLFREYYLIQQKDLQKSIGMILYFKPNYLESMDSFITLITENTRTLFADRIVETGVRKAFKGNWGANANTKKIGVVQDLNRLSWFTYGDMVRKIILPMESSSKAVGPHLLHASQWGYMDPVDSPDGGNIGLHKHLAITTSLTIGFPGSKFIGWLWEHFPNLRKLEHATPLEIFQKIRVFVNGNWIGLYPDNPFDFMDILKKHRRLGLLPLFLSISFDIRHKILSFYTDSGRVSRPIFYLDGGSWSKTWKTLPSRTTWRELTQGTLSVSSKPWTFLEKEDLEKAYQEHRALVEYIDCSEEECALIALTPPQSNHTRYTHLEIHASMLFGIMGNSIIFPENNQFPRDCFSCSQSRQAVSVSHTNAESRMDKMLVLLQNGQVPLVKSPYLNYINHELPYGFNTVVAIMSYTGYNVEDAILINEGAIQRGLFRTTYYTTYESQELSEKVQGTDVRSYFTNIEKHEGVRGLKPGVDYSQLDEMGLIREKTRITDKLILIGQILQQVGSQTKLDKSVRTKKGQLGVVDKTFLTESEEGFRIAKVRIREDRLPGIGDKMASRAGQKGTIGRIVAERDMPFTADGQRPDLIINPHALPSRMTIGHLIEVLLGNVCATYGYFGNCGAFMTEGPNTELYGSLLQKYGLSSNGKSVMYDGFSGNPIQADIYLGNTFYMRLKHMVKDKINYRARGPRNNLTRQTVQGRANDGGLRIGEMERDGILAHGASAFLTESFMIRGDQYYLAICNQTGHIAFYDASIREFYSPWIDGPLVWKDMKVLGKEAFPVHGTSFSVVRIPYSLKLFIQELQVLNIEMRLITEEAFGVTNRMENLSFGSQNIQKLLHMEGATNAEVLTHFKTSLIQKLRGQSGGSTSEATDIPYYSISKTKESDEKADDEETADDEKVDEKKADEKADEKVDEKKADEEETPKSEASKDLEEVEINLDDDPITERQLGISSTSITSKPIFDNPLWEEYYQKLSKTTQIQILEKSPEEREKLMQGIITEMQDAENKVFASNQEANKPPESTSESTPVISNTPLEIETTKQPEEETKESGKIVVQKED